MSRDWVSDALRHSATQSISLTAHGATINARSLADVADRVDAGTVALAGPRGAGDAGYDSITDTLHMPSADGGIGQKMLAIHEGCHVVQDLARVRALIAEIEAVAFIAQATFFVVHEAPRLGMAHSEFVAWVVSRPGTVGSVLEAALRAVIANGLVGRAAVLRSRQLEPVASAVLQHPVYRNSGSRRLRFDGACGCR